MMKTASVIMLAATLSGCAAFGTFQNPITENRLAAIESGYGIALSAAVAYRDACNRRVIAWNSCAPIVKQLRRYDTDAITAIKVARGAMASGDTISIVSALTSAQTALSAFQNVEAANGVK